MQYCICKEDSKLEKKKKVRIKYFIGSQECGVSQQNNYTSSTETCKTFRTCSLCEEQLNHIVSPPRNLVLVYKYSTVSGENSYLLIWS